MNEKENNHKSNQFNDFLACPSNHVEIENDLKLIFLDISFKLKEVT